MTFRNAVPFSDARFKQLASLSKARSKHAACNGKPQSDPVLTRQCRLLEKMVENVVDLLPASGLCRVRSNANCRQITLYLCHVSLGVSQVKIARIFGISRTVVRKACQAIENRRDDRHLDDILEIIGRLANHAALSAQVRDDS